MNRLILIGNGFDLAHGLKTDYNSFILWYLKLSFAKASVTGSCEDDIVKITTTGNNYIFRTKETPTVEAFVDYYYQEGFSMLLFERLKINNIVNQFDNPFSVRFKSRFSQNIISNCNSTNWVDIENEFYDQLKDCNSQRYVDTDGLNALNKSLANVIVQLEIYLSGLKTDDANMKYLEVITSKILRNDILKCALVKDELPVFTMVLNFNYTDTIEKYFSSQKLSDGSLPGVEINYIHGQLNNEENPLIFGFGDELDADYKKMELTKTNAFFEYIKSFWYFKNSNYHNLIRFIDSDEYQILTLGHSCGLSDRTLLNMIFEHPNCKSIKIFYHGNKARNNHKRLTQEIARQFKDKVEMRRKIVPLDRSEPMPQIIFKV